MLQAYAAGGETMPAGGLTSLRTLQYPACGAWAYTWDGDVKGVPDVGATIGADPRAVADAVPAERARRGSGACDRRPAEPMRAPADAHAFGLILAVPALAPAVGGTGAGVRR